MKRFSQIKRERSALSKNPWILFIIPHFLVSSHDPWGCGTRGKRGPWGVSENGQRVKWQGPLLEHLERLKRWSLLLNGVHSLQYSWSVPWSLAAEGSLATWADLLCLLCNQAAGAPSVKFHGWQPYSNTLTRILTKFIWASPMLIIHSNAVGTNATALNSASSLLTLMIVNGDAFCNVKLLHTADYDADTYLLEEDCSTKECPFSSNKKVKRKGWLCSECLTKLMTYPQNTLNSSWNLVFDCRTNSEVE